MPLVLFCSYVGYPVYIGIRYGRLDGLVDAEKRGISRGKRRLVTERGAAKDGRIKGDFHRTTIRPSVTVLQEVADYSFLGYTDNHFAVSRRNRIPRTGKRGMCDRTKTRLARLTCDSD